MRNKIRIPERLFSREENEAARIEEFEQRRRHEEEIQHARENDEPILDYLSQDDRRGGDPLPLDRLFRD